MFVFKHLYVCLCSACFPLNHRCISCFYAACSAERPEKDWKSSATFLEFLYQFWELFFSLNLWSKLPGSVLLQLRTLTLLAWLESVSKSYSVAAVQLIPGWRKNGRSPPNQNFLHHILISYHFFLSPLPSILFSCPEAFFIPFSHRCS